jgi:hypothetical protein
MLPPITKDTPPSANFIFCCKAQQIKFFFPLRGKYLFIKFIKNNQANSCTITKIIISTLEIKELSLT